MGRLDANVLKMGAGALREPVPAKRGGPGRRTEQVFAR